MQPHTGCKSDFGQMDKKVSILVYLAWKLNVDQWPLLTATVIPIVYDTCYGISLRNHIMWCAVTDAILMVDYEIKHTAHVGFVYKNQYTQIIRIQSKRRVGVLF